MTQRYLLNKHSRPMAN